MNDAAVVIEDAWRQFRRLSLEAYRWADEIRWSYQLVDSAREVATRLGVECDQ
jgi:hypothetical protein